MRRVSTAELFRVAADLSERERELVMTVAKLRLASHTQLACLLDDGSSTASAPSRARLARRTLLRLSELGLLARLTRRVGGVRAGSRGYCYYLGPAGQRLTAFWEGRGLVRGRFRPEPGAAYVRHRLSVSELYVRMVLPDRVGRLELLSFEVEPDCWRQYLDGYGGRVTLKPDAFVRVGVGAFEESSFVEVDLGSESRTVLSRKVCAHLDYFASGIEQAQTGVFPRVLILANSAARCAAVAGILERLPEGRELFRVGRLDQAQRLLAGGDDEPAGHREAAGGTA
jgi:Replication-relaxation